MKRIIAGQLQKVRAEVGGSSPWVYLVLVQRILQLAANWLAARWQLWSMDSLGQLVLAKGRMQIQQLGHATMGTRVRVWSIITPTQLYVAPKAELTIGDGCFLNGCLIAAHERITIGNNAYIAPSAQLADSHAFGMSNAAQHTAPIELGDDTWIATRAIILPGVRIGKGAVVGVGALVTEDVPPYALVAGVPAKIIRYIETT